VGRTVLLRVAYRFEVKEKIFYNWFKKSIFLIGFLEQFSWNESLKKDLLKMISYKRFQIYIYKFFHLGAFFGGKILSILSILSKYSVLLFIFSQESLGFFFLSRGSKFHFLHFFLRMLRKHSFCYYF
jgi:hypothetical protein